MDGTRVRVLAGSWGGVASPMAVANELVWLDVHVPAGGPFESPAPSDEHAFVFLIDGTVTTTHPTADRGAVLEHAGFVFDDEGDTVAAHAGPAGAQLLYGAGRPLDEPILAAGSFMMSTRQRLDDAVARLQAGEMGRLAPSF